MLKFLGEAEGFYHESIFKNVLQIMTIESPTGFQCIYGDICAAQSPKKTLFTVKCYYLTHFHIINDFDLDIRLEDNIFECHRFWNQSIVMWVK